MGLDSNPLIFQYVKWGLQEGQKRDFLDKDEGGSIDVWGEIPYTVDKIFSLEKR
jgi:cytochrome c551/c552